MKVLPSDSSKSSESIKFHSKNLNDAFKKVSHIFDMHQQDINSVSSDIKTLEAYIQSRNIVVSYSKEYHVGEGTKYRLHWDKPNEETKEFRLLCGVEQYEVENDMWREVDERPLIESSLPTRMAIYPYLADFMQSVANAITIYNRKQVVEASFSESDIPF